MTAEAVNSLRFTIDPQDKLFLIFFFLLLLEYNAHEDSGDVPAPAPQQMHRPT